MRYPEFLLPGGRIGFVAPSFGCATEPYKTRYEAALKLFRGLGYRTVEGPCCRRADGCGKSSSPENCAAELNAFFKEDRCDVIFSCGGGETMCEDLPFVDFEGIRAAAPKWYMGYSDNTNLILPLVTMCDTAAVYGPHAPDFGMNPWHEAVTDAFMTVCGTVSAVSNYDGWERTSSREEVPLAPYAVTEPFRMIPAGTAKLCGEFSGRLIGGCLDCLVTLCGTKFDAVKAFSEKYAEDGIIWVLEACDLNPMGIRRALWQLENAGWFQHVSGFLIGRPLNYDMEMLGMNRLNAVTGILDKYGVPVLMDLDVGHLSPSMPLVMGSLARVMTEGNSITVEEKFV